MYGLIAVGQFLHGCQVCFTLGIWCRAILTLVCYARYWGWGWDTELFSKKVTISFGGLESLCVVCGVNTTKRSLHAELPTSSTGYLWPSVPPLHGLPTLRT